MKPQSADFEIRRLTPLGAAALLLSACGSIPFSSAGMDPTSPIADEAAGLARSRTAYPRFSDIPKLPTDQRPLREFGRAADRLKTARADLESRTGPDSWTLTGGEDFGARARAALPPAEPIDPADSEALARQLRERATPPPPR